MVTDSCLDGQRLAILEVAIHIYTIYWSRHIEEVSDTLPLGSTKFTFASFEDSGEWNLTAAIRYLSHLYIGRCWSKIEPTNDPHIVLSFRSVSFILMPNSKIPGVSLYVNRGYGEATHFSGSSRCSTPVFYFADVASSVSYSPTPFWESSHCLVARKASIHSFGHNTTRFRSNHH